MLVSVDTRPSSCSPFYTARNKQILLIIIVLVPPYCRPQHLQYFLETVPRPIILYLPRLLAIGFYLNHNGFRISITLKSLPYAITNKIISICNTLACRYLHPYYRQIATPSLLILSDLIMLLINNVMLPLLALLSSLTRMLKRTPTNASASCKRSL